jgi:hypothetical protein
MLMLSPVCGDLRLRLCTVKAASMVARIVRVAQASRLIAIAAVWIKPCHGELAVCLLEARARLSKMPSLNCGDILNSSEFREAGMTFEPVRAMFQPMLSLAFGRAPQLDNLGWWIAGRWSRACNFCGRLLRSKAIRGGFVTSHVMDA